MTELRPPAGRGAPGTCKIGFVGDLMLGRQLNRAYARFAPDTFWSDIGPTMRACDTVLANLECPITEATRPDHRCRKAFRFRARREAIDVLGAGNVGYVSLANNHTMDFGEAGLRDTVERLTGARIAHGGAGADLATARAGTVLTVGNTKLGIVAFTDNVPEFAAAPSCPGTNYLSIRAEAAALEAIGAEVARLRADGVHLVVVSGHWGWNCRRRPSARFRRFARKVIDLGVDIFHGHSAHLLHGVERRGRGAILYDTGDFLDDYWVLPGFRIDRSAIFIASFTHSRLTRLSIVPASLHRMRVGLAPPREFKAICGHLWRQSRSWGTRLTPVADALVLDFDRPDTTAASCPDWAMEREVVPCAA